MSMVWGRPINPRNVERLVGDAHKTLEEFGSPGNDVQQLLDGPFADPNARREFQNRTLQLSAGRLGRFSPFYQQLFAKHGVDPKNLTIDDMAAIPVTRKSDLLEREQDFITTNSKPYMTTRTTGTTGHPAEIWISQYEIQLWAALAALSGLLRGEIGPKDCLQINISSRATAAVQLNMNVARLAHMRTRVLGVIPPDESLDSLLTGGDEAPTQMNTYPSYLAEIIHAARRRGLGPRDFRLKRVINGGEPLTSAVKRAGQETLGAEIDDAFGMTEVLPVSGRICSQGHMHHDLNMGYVEVVDLDTGELAPHGALGSVVITTFYPYRECMPVFRYDTRDVVRVLPDAPLTCELAGVPATSKVLGKADHLLRVKDRIVTTRDLVEVYEALPSDPWPARFSARVVDDHIELTMPEDALKGITPSFVERRFAEVGIAVRVAGETLTAPDEIAQLRPLRVDLLEKTFAGRK